MKNILQFIKDKPNYSYHFAWCILGVIITFSKCINDFGVSKGILVGFVTLIIGTLGFFILPLVFITMTVFVRFIPVFAIFVYIALLIGKASGEVNMIDEYGYINLFVYSALLSGFGYFNIITAIKANKEGEEDNSLVSWPFIF